MKKRKQDKGLPARVNEKKILLSCGAERERMVVYISE